MDRCTAALGALPPGDTAVVRRDGRDVLAVELDDVVVSRGAHAFHALGDLERGGGFWVGFASYDLGRSVEHIRTRATDDVDVPDLVLARFRAHATFARGAPPRVVGARRGASLLRDAIAEPVRSLPLPAVDHWRSSLDRDDYVERVAAILELIRAGDCYQVNLTRRLRSPRAADPRALFTELRRRNPSPHGALVDLREWVGVAVVSASPERFLARRGHLVETRPVKGTGSDPAALMTSGKDRAENVMIVDLARNDLGRVCEPGSIEVTELCALEPHPGLHHLVSTVRGRLRTGAGTAELLAATMPPASVTGAPKPRVLQAIEDLEPVRRGVYCGAVGWIDADAGEADLAVAIRTFVVTPAGTDLGVGAGIVADSVPLREWEETELKACRLLSAATAGGALGGWVMTGRVAG
jgi:para-aminobenzoate synthetase component I